MSPPHVPPEGRPQGGFSEEHSRPVARPAFSFGRPPAAGALPRTPLKNLLKEVLKNLQNFLVPLRGVLSQAFTFFSGRLGYQVQPSVRGIPFISPHPRGCANKKFRKGKGMGVRGKGRGKPLFKGFPSPLPPAPQARQSYARSCRKRMTWARMSSRMARAAASCCSREPVTDSGSGKAQWRQRVSAGRGGRSLSTSGPEVVTR